MGFANISERATPAPRYKNTVVCRKCHAEYDKDVKFNRGINVFDGTRATTGIVLGTVPSGCCPVCLTKQLEE